MSDRYVETRAYVWWCGEECGCTQPVVEAVYWTVDGHERLERVWSGRRRTGHAEGADEELAAHLDAVRTPNP